MSSGILELIKVRYEVEILADRQVFPEAETLRHVPDLALDRFGVGVEVQAKHRALSGIGAQQAAQHPDRGRLARAIRTQEAPHLPLRNRDIDRVDGGLRSKPLGKPPNIDCVRGGHHNGRMPTGWPGLSFRPPGARASILNTSFDRFSSEKITGGVNSSWLAMKLTRATRLPGQPSQEI